MPAAQISKTLKTLQTGLEKLIAKMQSDADSLDKVIAQGEILLNPKSGLKKYKDEIEKKLQTKISTIRKNTHRELQELEQNFENEILKINQGVSKLFNKTIIELERVKQDELRKKLKK